MCGDGKKAASSDGEDEDDLDPYGGAATSAQAAPAPSAAAQQVTSYVYDITAPYYEVLTETTEGGDGQLRLRPGASCGPQRGLLGQPQDGIPLRRAGLGGAGVQL